MFYPVESLKRGGRFYLCWVADSWPLRFATITHRQLWSQDIRKICDDLLHVMTNESGRPTNRFSLRLSSQLMRGVVRLYQRKVTVFLGDLCMLNANVIKNTNKKWHKHEVVPTHEPQRLQIVVPQVFVQEDQEAEQRVEEMIQNSGNVVAHIEDITLKEATIPDQPQPIDDGFGEEHPSLAVQMLAERTLEFMLQGEGSIQHSGLELVDKSHDKSADKTQDRSRMALEPQMERISEIDVSMLRVPGEDLLRVSDIDKEIPDISEIPKIPHPEPPAPIQQTEMQITDQQATVQAETLREVPEIREEPIEIELEELEEGAVQTRRRKVRDRLIIDRSTKLTSNFISTRLRNINLELRCEDSRDDIVSVLTPWDVYFGRPCHSGARFMSNLGSDITRLFIRNLGAASTRPLIEREMEEMRVHYPYARSVLERIEEVGEPTLHQETRAPPEQIPEVDITHRSVPRVSTEQIDISELPTQRLEAFQTRKRPGEPDISITPKRLKVGNNSFRLSQQLAAESAVTHLEAEKENIGVEEPLSKRPRRSTVLKDISQIHQDVPGDKETEKSVITMLQEAGLADVQPAQIDQPVDKQKSQRQRSESSETPLGSLDRTKVSLGDSEQTTDSKRFIRDQWGTEGTMVKILQAIKLELVPVTVSSLIAKGPIISGHEKIIAARCFTSMLKLKHHGFITILKNADSLEIEDVTLGPKFY